MIGNKNKSKISCKLNYGAYICHYLVSFWNEILARKFGYKKTITKNVFLKIRTNIIQDKTPCPTKTVFFVSIETWHELEHVYLYDFIYARIFKKTGLSPLNTKHRWNASMKKHYTITHIYNKLFCVRPYKVSFHM